MVRSSTIWMMLWTTLSLSRLRLKNYPYGRKICHSMTRRLVFRLLTLWKESSQRILKTLRFTTMLWVWSQTTSSQSLISVKTVSSAIKKCARHENISLTENTYLGCTSDNLHSILISLLTISGISMENL